MISFQGMVAVITGAGGGLGRTYSLELAKRGAYVVVNDLGGLRDGKGKSSSAANSVVNEIVSLGGKAVANYDTVEEGDKIVKSAIENFGKIDILINNAGIIRDKSFARMSEDDWNKVYKVHLMGAFKTSHCAWNYMKTQNFGRIIFTTSASGIYGNFGQANYSSAKSGLIGFCKSLSVEGMKYNINCNAIAPLAGSRMTEDVFPEEIFNALKPEYVAPLVLYLCSQECQETGSVFEVGGGWMGKVHVGVSKGNYFGKELLTPENVQEKWPKICDSSETSNLVTIKDSMYNILGHLSQQPEEANVEVKKILSLEDAVGLKISKTVKPYTFKDVILYALSVGVDSVNGDTLKFLYENHNNFTCLPTFSVIPVIDLALEMFEVIIQNSNLDLNLFQALHGEQYLEVHKPIPVDEKLFGEVEVTDVIDKVRGTLLVIKVTLSDSQKEVLSKAEIVLYLNGFGGLSTNRNARTEMVNIKPVPKRQPDVVLDRKININQGALYRLTGDLNPLHIDPYIANVAGFNKPILHGLCVFGMVGYQLVENFLHFNCNGFKNIKLRFSKPVIPGQTISFEYWKNGDLIQFQCKNKETGEICINGGFAHIEDENKYPNGPKL